MNKKKAVRTYGPNTFDIINEGGHVVCAVSGRKIALENLSYWSVELQEAYYSPVEVKIKHEGLKK